MTGPAAWLRTPPLQGTSPCVLTCISRPNLVSPVADRLRRVISLYPWGQTGLGLPLIKETQNEGTYHQDWSAVNGSVISESENQDSAIVDASLLASKKPKTETFRPQTQIHSQGLSSSTSTVSEVATIMFVSHPWKIL
ncbi:zinc finger protein-like 1 [Penaeus monodon]|uniref:zinc finger protein-like 1 n=1 Tax=Penaeus monodon TaxID=6687 RepID=UPI0018A78CD9|nr:zinc finger protein-like 1 [Penaeus monodon]